jgi:hypothetical protein
MQPGYVAGCIVESAAKLLRGRLRHLRGAATSCRIVTAQEGLHGALCVSYSFARLTDSVLQFAVNRVIRFIHRRLAFWF